MMVNGEMKVFLVVLVMMISTSQGDYWTGWYDFDNPSGNGDYERTTDHPSLNNWRPCGARKSKYIHAKVKGQPTSSGIRTQDSLVVGPKYGLYCIWACKDYEVRYYGFFQTSNWIDLDDPPTDDERASQVDNLPFGIRYIRIRLQGSVGSYRVDQKIKLSPTYGLRCINSDQSSGQCADYVVRYYCGDFLGPYYKASA